MRERLIELIRQKSCVYVPCDNECGGCKNTEMYDDSIDSLADHLLSNGVIVPPCKVGDTVYVINDWEVEKTTVFSMKIESTDSHWMTFVKAKIIDHGIKFEEGHWYMLKTFVFGKTAFLAREEAEKALKGE